MLNPITTDEYETKPTSSCGRHPIVTESILSKFRFQLSPGDPWESLAGAMFQEALFPVALFAKLPRARLLHCAALPANRDRQKKWF